MRLSSMYELAPRRSCAAPAPSATPPTTAAAQPPSNSTASASETASRNGWSRMNLLGSVFEGIAAPVQRGCGGVAGNRDHVEAARSVGQTRMGDQKDLRGAHEFRALAGVHGIDAITEHTAAPIAHLDEHDGAAL